MIFGNDSYVRVSIQMTRYCSFFEILYHGGCFSLKHIILWIFYWGAMRLLQICCVYSEIINNPSPKSLNAFHMFNAHWNRIIKNKYLPFILFSASHSFLPFLMGIHTWTETHKWNIIFKIKDKNSVFSCDPMIKEVI